MDYGYKAPKESDKVSCPECGSSNTGKIENADVKSMPDNVKLNKYHCGDCKCSFIPAMESVQSTQDVWAKKLRMNEHMNENASWKTKKGQTIVIKPDILVEGLKNEKIYSDDIITTMLKMFFEEKAFTKQALIHEVAQKIKKLNDGRTDIQATNDAAKLVNKLLEKFKSGKLFK